MDIKEWVASEVEEYDDERLEKSEDGKISLTRLYFKSDVDPIIADLESKVRSGEKQIEDLINSASGIMLFQDKVNGKKCEENRHSSYKRCEAMMWLCLSRCELYNQLHSYKRVKFYGRWHNRWYKLMEYYQRKG